MFKLGIGETSPWNVLRINGTITLVGLKPSRLAEKLESRLWLLNASGSGRVTATVAKMSLVTILVNVKHSGNAWD